MVRGKTKILNLYDLKDPKHPSRIITGYDKAHVARTTKIVTKIAKFLGIDGHILNQLEIATLLHDIGRVGMDPHLFGKIFGSAERKGIPVRLNALLQKYPNVSPSTAPAFFLDLIRPTLREENIPIDNKTRDHIGMRMSFANRLKTILDSNADTLQSLHIRLEPWMEKVILYYYYPEVMLGVPPSVLRMGMILVASENFEAYNNVARTQDYYHGRQASIREAFKVLNQFKEAKLISEEVISAITKLTLTGQFTTIIKESQGLKRNTSFSTDDKEFLAKLGQEEFVHNQ